MPTNQLSPIIYVQLTSEKYFQAHSSNKYVYAIFQVCLFNLIDVMLFRVMHAILLLKGAMVVIFTNVI